MRNKSVKVYLYEVHVNLTLLRVVDHRARAWRMSVPQKDCLVCVRGHLEVPNVTCRFADTFPVWFEHADWDFVDVGPAVSEGVNACRTTADEFGDDETGVSDCAFE